MQPDKTVGQLTDGDVLAGRYRVQSLIGRGGMAEVYCALDERLARGVAVKVLRASYGRDTAFRARFEEEARAAAMVSHPNVVAIFDAGEDGDAAFIVMELVNGETLAGRISRGPLGKAAARRIAGEVLDALAAAHSRGVLHRDIKPANVILSPEGTVKVADFGIAKAAHPSPDGDEPTTMNVVLGTPSYLAPERAQGRPATVRSDLWSVGVMLYESLTATKPFEGANPVAVARAAEEGRYRPVEDLRPDADPALVAVISRALRPDPADRFTSAAEMARVLRDPGADPSRLVSPLASALAGGATALLPPPKAPAYRRTERVRPERAGSFRRPLVLAGLVAVLLAGVVSLSLASSSHPQPALQAQHTRPPAGAKVAGPGENGSPAPSGAPAGTSAATARAAGNRPDGTSRQARRNRGRRVRGRTVRALAAVKRRGGQQRPRASRVVFASA